MIEYVHSLFPNKTITITSNGYQINEEVIERLEKANQRIAILSYDGPYQDVNRRTVGGQQTHERLEQQIKLIPKSWLDKMTLRQTVQPNQRLVPIYEDGLRFGAQSVTPVHNIFGSDPNMIDQNFIRDIVIELAEYFNFKLPPTRLYVEIIEKIRNGSETGTFCRVMGNAVTLNPDGWLSQCHHNQDWQKIYNIHTDELKTDNINYIRSAKMRIASYREQCQTCQAKPICPAQGQCPSQFHEATGRIDEPNQQYCNLQNGFYQGFQYWASKQNIVRLEDDVDETNS